ncbi:MAG: hypothetical protein OXI87_17200 [Albidovulum sp.]|nr:hypothetical protein [Albidovulum sp.]MDE0306591.1 hypothetical protein [Albidovulum sp.]MDE0530525.1 hypothetical protein [Albidovulum sp.]
MNGSSDENLELERYFAALRQETPLPSKRLADAMLRDARTHAPIRKNAKPESVSGKPGILEIFISIVGGPIPAAALAATILVGIGLGYGTIDYFAELAVEQTEFELADNEIFTALDELLAEV